MKRKIPYQKTPFQRSKRGRLLLAAQHRQREMRALHVIQRIPAWKRRLVLLELLRHLKYRPGGAGYKAARRRWYRRFK